MKELTEDAAPKDTRFNPSRLPATAKAQALVDEIRKQLLNYEAHRHPRRRKRRASYQERFDRIVTALVCDLAHSAMTDPAAWRHISLSKRRHGQDAVGAEFMTEARIPIIEWMSSPEMGWLELVKAERIRNPFGGQQSTIRASARLRRYLEDHDIQFEDLGRDPELMGDPIVLKGVKVRGKAKALPVPEGEPVATYRAEMSIINAALVRAEVTCGGVTKLGGERDTGDRWLKRIFNDGRLDQGGRLYGGFWQGMSVESRLQDLQINGEEVVSLDFGQCGIRIAYGRVGAEPPQGDLYCVPGLEQYRKGVKTVLTAQLSMTKAMTRKPRNTSRHFHRSMSIREIEEPIIRHHRPIRALFYTGFGLTMQFIESQVLVRCLLRLIDQQLIALPVHDCLVVPRSSAETTRQLMLDTFEEMVGVQGAVNLTEALSPGSQTRPFPPPRVLDVHAGDW